MKNTIRRNLKIHDTVFFILASAAFFWSYSTAVGAITNITIPGNEWWRVLPEFCAIMGFVNIYAVFHLWLYPRNEKSLRNTLKYNGYWLMIESAFILLNAIIFSATRITRAPVQETLGPLYPLDTYLLPFVIAAYGYYFVRSEKKLKPENYMYFPISKGRHHWNNFGVYFEGQFVLWSVGAVICPIIFNAVNWGNPEWVGPFLLYVALAINAFLYIYYNWKVRGVELTQKAKQKKLWILLLIAIIPAVLSAVVFTSLDPDVVSLYMAWTFQMDLMTSKFVTAWFVGIVPLLYVVPKLIRFYLYEVFELTWPTKEKASKATKK